jgi:thiamine-monophosphate kinase
MTERALIAWIQKRVPRFGQRLRLGIGDDCAIYRPKPGDELLFTTDFTIEDRHFTWKDYKPIEAGWKAMARGLSDIAAMGGSPEFALVSLAAKDACIIKGFFAGLIRCASHYGVSIAGGDLTESPRLYCDITVAGRVPQGKAILRSGARPGDFLYVTGPLGLWQKKPLPRLDLRAQLQRSATAAIDVTDGLAMDLERLLLASGVSAAISADPPIQPGATLEQAWHEGEAYELLFTSPRKLAFPLLGRIAAGQPGTILRDGKALSTGGWDPFVRQP